MVNQSSPLKKEEHLINIDLSEELKTYLSNNFKSKKTIPPFENEIGIKYWEDFAKKITADKLLFNELKKCYLQLNFPIEIGIEKTEFYKNIVLRGKTENINLPFSLKLSDPKNIAFKIHKSIAGKIPIVTVPNKEDFTTIIQSLLYKNNPKHVPQSMGAVLINGINNWERLMILKNDWLTTNTSENWVKEFSCNVLPNKSLYKDKLIILSTKPYSNVAAKQLGLNKSLWLSYSISIREEHECTHLYTLKKFGVASNNLHDELIADYIGIVKTIGHYNKSWMLIFMGLEEYPKYRQGARLENYLLDNKLSQGDFKQLIKIIKNAIENISIFDKTRGKLQSNLDQMCRIDALCETSLEELSSANGASLLIDNYNKRLEKET
ncbi:hypothetical protein CLU83_1332 [Flavobacterium sp. 1]|uniref:DUF7005 family protein n=1 Tax=Flavobacterium sp. 1 TaxID=2035200 RepID=UPI000C23B39C|nr:hypothetical protein [Flavobacterium sp. 1]PJJ08095.1 hypothetical protein CLU83_1332 [Flavobacterium sp. 1]